MKKAVCMGTNYVGTSSELSWCVKDATDMTSFLKGRGFVVDTYLEKEASAVRFKNELKGLVDQALAGEITGAVLSHSGHGTQGYTTSETDFYNEGCYFLDGVVWDDEVASILSKIPEGFPFFIFLDTCFSGGMMKFVGKNKIKFFPTTRILPTSKLKKGLKEATANAVYISACSEGEYSYDAGDLKNGAGTSYLLKSFINNNQFGTWHTKLRTYLPTDQYPQTPELICKEELKTKNAFSWFEPVTTGIPDIEPTKPPVNETLKKNWLIQLLKKLISWLKNIWTYIIKS